MINAYQASLQGRDSVKKEKKKKKEKLRQPEPARELSEQSVPVRNPLLETTALIGGKWKMPILWALREGQPVRYRELRQRVPGITDMMLSQSLRELTAAGLVERRQYQEIPPKVEYCMTSEAAGLVPALETLSVWTDKTKKG